MFLPKRCQGKKIWGFMSVDVSSRVSNCLIVQDLFVLSGRVLLSYENGKGGLIAKIARYLVRWWHIYFSTISQWRYLPESEVLTSRNSLEPKQRFPLLELALTGSCHGPDSPPITHLETKAKTINNKFNRLLHLAMQKAPWQPWSSISDPLASTMYTV